LKCFSFYERAQIADIISMDRVSGAVNPLRNKASAAGCALLTSAVLAFGQEADQKPAPIYSVSVVQSTIEAVNYRYRTGPYAHRF
jgi:hypothetical protein